MPHDSLTHAIGERLRQTRHDRQLSLSELTLRTGGVLSKSRISNYEQGIRRMNLESAQILAEALEVSPVWLLGLTDRRDISEQEQRLLELFRQMDRRGRDTLLKSAQTE